MLGWRDTSGTASGYLELSWPDEEWIAHFRSLMESADTPDLTDHIIKEVVYEEGVDALNGFKAVDETVAEIMNRIAEER